MTATWPVKGALPVADTAILVEGSLERFRLEGMFFEFVFIDFDAQAGSVARAGLAPFLIYEKSFPGNVVAPGDVEVHRFADEVGRFPPRPRVSA